MLHKIEQKWMCQLHGILQLPRNLFRTVVLPLHLYLPYGSVPEHCDLPVEDVHWLDLELSLEFHSEVNMIPNTELPVHPMLICIAFLSVLCCFQILPDLYNLLQLQHFPIILKISGTLLCLGLACFSSLL